MLGDAVEDLSVLDMLILYSAWMLYPVVVSCFLRLEHVSASPLN